MITMLKICYLGCNQTEWFTDHGVKINGRRLSIAKKGGIELFGVQPHDIFGSVLKLVAPSFYRDLKRK